MKMFYYSLIVMCLLISSYITFDNPDMTSTRLFLEFWHVHITMIAVAIFSSWRIDKIQKKERSTRS